MKKEIPQGAIIGAVVVVVLLVIGFAWRTLTAGNPPRENVSASAIKPDPLPAGMDPSNARPAPPARGRSIVQ